MMWDGGLYDRYLVSGVLVHGVLGLILKWWSWRGIIRNGERCVIPIWVVRRSRVLIGWECWHRILTGCVLLRLIMGLVMGMSMLLITMVDSWSHCNIRSWLGRGDSRDRLELGAVRDNVSASVVGAGAVDILVDGGHRMAGIARMVCLVHFCQV